MFSLILLANKSEHIVKIDNIISMDFAKTPILYYWENLVCLALDNSAFQIHFALSQTFMKMIKIWEVLLTFFLVK